MLVWGTFDHCTHLGLHFTPTDAACVGFKRWPGLQSWPRGQARLQALSESVEAVHVQYLCRVNKTILRYI